MASFLSVARRRRSTCRSLTVRSRVTAQRPSSYPESGKPDGTHHGDVEHEAVLGALGGAGTWTRRQWRLPGADFVQAPDPIDPTRINVFERWASDEDLEAFRSSENSAETLELDPPEIRAADVARYQVVAVGAP